MWEIVWKEKRYAWAKTLLSIGKIAVNIAAWIIVYSLYFKSKVFVMKAKEMLESSEYETTDILAADKIQVVHLLGAFLTVVIMFGTVILFWCIVRGDMKRKYARIGFYRALGYQQKDVFKHYSCHVLIDTMISLSVGAVVAVVAWHFLMSSFNEYGEMMDYVGMKRDMEMFGLVYAWVVALVIQFFALAVSIHDTKKRNIRGLMTEK